MFTLSDPREESWAPASLSEAHSQWHAMNGKYAVCDLDCGAGEHIGQAFDDDAQALAAGEGGRIRCGHCQHTHAYVSTVALCATLAADRERFHY